MGGVDVISTGSLVAAAGGLACLLPPSPASSWRFPAGTVLLGVSALGLGGDLLDAPGAAESSAKWGMGVISLLALVGGVLAVVAASPKWLVAGYGAVLVGVSLLISLVAGWCGLVNLVVGGAVAVQVARRTSRGAASSTPLVAVREPWFGIVGSLFLAGVLLGAVPPGSARGGDVSSSPLESGGLVAAVALLLIGLAVVGATRERDPSSLVGDGEAEC